jgi:predicted amidohydrolase
VLICADCWFPENYVQMKSERADVIVVPAMSSNAKAWNELWNGYSAAKTPCDVDTGLINKPGVTLGHMWQK